MTEAVDDVVRLEVLQDVLEAIGLTTIVEEL